VKLHSRYGSWLAPTTSAYLYWQVVVPSPVCYLGGMAFTYLVGNFSLIFTSELYKLMLLEYYPHYNDRTKSQPVFMTDQIFEQKT